MKYSLYQFLLFITLSLSCLMLQAQNQIGKWTAYFPFETGGALEQNETSVFYKTAYAVAIFDKVDGSVTYWNSVNRLSDGQLKFMKYNEELDVMAISYENSNIDFVYADKTVNFNAIEKNLDIVGAKNIRSIYTQDSIVVFSTGFGMVQFNLSSEESDYTTFIDGGIDHAYFFENNYFVLYEGSLYQVDINTKNILDFQSWTEIELDEIIDQVFINGEKIIVASGNRLYVYENGGLTFLYENPNPSIFKYVKEQNGRLLVGMNDQRLEIMDWQGNIEASYSNNCFQFQQDAIVVGDEILIGNILTTLKTFDPNTATCTDFKPNSPNSEYAADIRIYDDEIFVAFGKVVGNWMPTSSTRGSGIYTRGEGWRNYSIFSFDPSIQNAKDHLGIAYIPSTKKMYMASFVAGLLELDRNTDEVILYDSPSNSAINHFDGIPSVTRVSDVQEDSEGNIYYVNHGAVDQMGVYTNQQEWRPFKIPTTALLGSLMLDRNNNCWVNTIQGNNGIIVYHPQDMTLDNDYLYRRITTSNSELPNDVVHCATEDLDGEIWVGTNKGIVVFSCSDFYDASCQGSKPIIEQNNQNAYLFSELQVRHITVDGANRKWVGTNNGVYLVSENGREELLHFHKENSPLISNTITALEIDPKTGELFIGTDAGMLSYQTDATTGGNFHTADYKIYPNPVRPEYFGQPIAIDGLPENADVRIATINGDVVYETEANGGRAIWYGRDMQGNDVPAGVYLVFSTSVKSLENPDGHVGKVAVVR